MRKYLFALMVSSILFLVGCSSTAVKPQKTFTKTSDLATLDIPKNVNNWVDLAIENKTNDFIEVVWDSSNINDMPIGFEGDLIIKLGERKANTIIAPKEILNKRVFSKSILIYPIKIYIKVKQGQREDFLAIKLEDIGEKQEADFWTGEPLK